MIWVVVVSNPKNKTSNAGGGVHFKKVNLKWEVQRFNCRRQKLENFFPCQNLRQFDTRTFSLFHPFAQDLLILWLYAVSCIRIMIKLTITIPVGPQGRFDVGRGVDRLNFDVVLTSPCRRVTFQVTCNVVSTSFWQILDEIMERRETWETKHYMANV